MGTKICSNGPSHITEIASSLLRQNMVKNMFTIILKNQKADDLVCSSEDVGPTYCIQMMILG